MLSANSVVLNIYASTQCKRPTRRMGRDEIATSAVCPEVPITQAK